MISASGDLAQYLALRRANTQVSSGFETAAATVAEGKIQNLRETFQSDFRPLNAVQNTLTRIGAYQEAGTQAAFFLEQQQAALGAVGDLATALSQDMVAAQESAATGTLDTISASARSAFEQTVGTLNGAAGGRHLFSGAAVDTAPLPDGSAMLQTLSTEIAGMSHADAAAHIQTFFTDPAGGYAASFAGAESEGVSFTIGDQQSASADLTAMSPALRQALAAMATGALIADADVVGEAGVALLTSAQGIADARGTIGVTQERIETFQARNSAMATSMELRLTEMTTPDMYDAASELEQYEQALERLYLVTSRMASMNFAEFM
ncbi:hypothetical protein [Donghicola mangrovi]|uniref:Flagellin n=1 Tax=Donghicola mangrovi TaxID=2729614 RepID=A0A850Q095_9RHOB|nr:hypothetical protein [Donghicola mangrovi]NVO22424.1 hypothetical protein [Donghicola mangrovi]